MRITYFDQNPGYDIKILHMFANSGFYISERWVDKRIGNF